MSQDTDNAAIGSLATAHSMALAVLIDMLIAKKVLAADEIVGALANLSMTLAKADLGRVGPGSLDLIVQHLSLLRGQAGRA